MAISDMNGFVKSLIYVSHIGLNRWTLASKINEISRSGCVNFKRGCCQVKYFSLEKNLSERPSGSYLNERKLFYSWKIYMRDTFCLLLSKYYKKLYSLNTYMPTCLKSPMYSYVYLLVTYWFSFEKTILFGFSKLKKSETKI